MAIVKTIKHNNATVYIHDDYITHDPVKIQQALDEVATVVCNSLIRQAMRKIEAERAEAEAVV